MLLTTARDTRCVGIKIFGKSFESSENVMKGPDSLEEYVDKSIERAVELKSFVENERCDIENNNQIILNPLIRMPWTNKPTQSNGKNRKK